MASGPPKCSALRGNSLYKIPGPPADRDDKGEGIKAQISADGLLWHFVSKIGRRKLTLSRRRRDITFLSIFQN